jgi:hypothetical protein
MIAIGATQLIVCTLVTKADVPDNVICFTGLENSETVFLSAAASLGAKILSCQLLRTWQLHFFEPCPLRADGALTHRDCRSLEAVVTNSDLLYIHWVGWVAALPCKVAMLLGF